MAFVRRGSATANGSQMSLRSASAPMVLAPVQLSYSTLIPLVLWVIALVFWVITLVCQGLVLPLRRKIE